MEKAQKKVGVSPYFLVLLSLVGIIILGSFLLTLPVAHQDGQWGNYLDSFFISTSSTCVTGLSTYTKGITNELTIFGQVVMLLMIQIGGLGFITILTFIISVFIKRLKFRDRLFLSQAVSSTTVADVGKFVKRVVVIVVVVELSGFLLGLPVFLNIPEYSVGEALWKCFFTSVSAFNNAGFDLFGETSLIRGTGLNPVLDNMSEGLYTYLLIYIMLLIILGGLSFVAIIDMFFSHKKPRQYKAFTKIVLTMTSALIVLGTVSFLLSETTRTGMPFIHCLFQSVTTRTAGFASVNQATLTPAGKTISDILMLIGGSPISTAGGIKTTTIFIIIITFVRFLQGGKITAFHREYTRLSVLKSMSLVFVSLIIIVISFITIQALDPWITTENIFFEVFSAFGTVGLTAGVTTGLSVGSKLVVCVLMLFGRLGPITLFQIFQKNMEKEEDIHYRNVETDLLVG